MVGSYLLALSTIAHKNISVNHYLQYSVFNRLIYNPICICLIKLGFIMYIGIALAIT